MSTADYDVQRVQYLRSLNILDTDFDTNFDRITTLLETIFNVPIVLISLVDADRQWFKSCIGLDIRETSRELSFCSDAIEGDALYVVNDALYHPKYKLNRLVLEDPCIRFYAGKPITDNGYKLGTVCIIDRVPRTLSDTECQILDICGYLVESEIKKMDYIHKINENEKNAKSIAAIISHDLINVISPIIQAANIMRIENKNENIDELNIISSSANNALNLSKDILDNYKLELNQMILDKVSIYVPDLIHKFSKHYGNKLVINQVYAGYINIDLYRIEQVLSNIFENAMDFIGTSGQMVLTVEKNPTHVLFSIKDNGIGIPLDTYHLMFQKFSINVNPLIRRSHPRTGLGLYICQNIIELHNGKIWIEPPNEDERGMHICFTIPDTK
jgi:K+-sensing histidine kinase KdpD